MSAKLKFGLCATLALLLLFSLYLFTDAIDVGGGKSAQLPPAAANSTTTTKPETSGEPARVTAGERQTQSQPAPKAIDTENDIYGKAMDSAGKPVAGVSIVIFTDLWRDTSVTLARGDNRKRMRRQFGETKSDERGEFKISAIAAKNYDVEASAGGFGTVKLLDRHAGEYLQIILPRAATLTGRVLRDGKTPIADVRVRITWGSKPPFADYIYINTNKDGVYEAKNLAAREVTIQATPPADCAPRKYRLTLGEGETKQLDIIVEKGSYIFGIVTDADTGKPIENAEVADGWTYDRKVVTNGDGAFLLEGIKSTLPSLYVRAAGYGAVNVGIGHVTDSGVEKNVKLQKGRSARGRIVDDAGKPVEGAYVLAGAEFKDNNSMFTGADGLFHINDILRTVHHTLLIRKSGFGSVQFVFPANEEKSEIVEFGDIIIYPAGAISGVATDTFGKPIENVSVSLRGVNRDTDKYAEGKEYREELIVTQRNARTDARGRYYFCELSDGDYNVSAWFPVSCTPAPRTTVALQRGERANNCNLTIDLGLPIRGKILGPDQKPVSGAYVAILNPERENQSINYFAYMHTDWKGEFDFCGLAPGNYTIEVITSALMVFDVSVDSNIDLCAPSTRIANISAGSKSVTIQLKKNEPVEGIVVDRHGAPVEGVEIWDAKPWSNAAAVHTNRDGYFKYPVNEGENIKLGFNGPRDEDAAEPASQPTVDRTTYVDNIPAGKKGLVVKLAN